MSSPTVLTGTVTSPRVMSPILGAENLKVHRPEVPSGCINMVSWSMASLLEQTSAMTRQASGFDDSDVRDRYIVGVFDGVEDGLGIRRGGQGESFVVDAITHVG